jgi:plastocyanin
MLVAAPNALASEGGAVEGTLEGFGRGPYVVYVDEVPGAKAPDGARAVMNQKGNSYLPHILPVVAGSKVAFISEDPELHNVYAKTMAHDRVLFNVAIPPKAPPNVQRFDKAGVVRLTCNVHKEMLAFILVLQNPNFVLTEKGATTFRLENVPPGSYALRVWGEKLDETTLGRKFPVRVEQGQAAHVVLNGGES